VWLAERFFEVKLRELAANDPVVLLFAGGFGLFA
jgi:hypothetical protein